MRQRTNRFALHLAAALALPVLAGCDGQLVEATGSFDIFLTYDLRVDGLTEQFALITGSDLQNVLQAGNRPKRIKSVHIEQIGGDLDFLTLSSSVDDLILSVYVIDEEDNRLLTASADTIGRAELEASQLAFQTLTAGIGIASLEGRLNKAFAAGEGGSTGLPISVSVVGETVGGDLEADLTLTISGSVVYEFCQDLGAGPLAAFEVERPCDVDIF